MRKNLLEWAVFGIGLATTIVLVAYLGWQALVAGKGEAEFRVRLGESQKIDGGYRTRVIVENVGGATTRAVKVKIGGADLDLDYVPHGSKREGFVVTPEPPTSGSVASWQAP